MRITFEITMCAFAVKTSVKSPQTVADESATNDGVADKDVADEGVVPAYRFRRLTVRQVKFVYFIVFRAGRRITLYYQPIWLLFSLSIRPRLPPSTDRPTGF